MSQGFIWIGGWGLGAGYGVVNIVFFVLWILLLVWLVAYLFHPRNYQNHPYWGSAQDPLEILKTRYAKGEINKEQFEQMKKDLQSN